MSYNPSTYNTPTVPNGPPQEAVFEYQQATDAQESHYQNPNPAANYPPAAPGAEKPGVLPQTIPWETPTSRSGSTPKYATSASRSRLFTHPRTWSRRKRIIVAAIVAAIVVIIIGAAAGATVANQNHTKTCTCPGWTDSNGVYTAPTQYLCDANGNDIVTGKKNPCG